MTDLAKYDAACRAIADAKSVDEIKGIGDVSRAMKAAARIVNNRQAVVDWSEVYIRAERRLGEMIRAQKEGPGLATGGEYGGRTKIDGTRDEPSNQRPTLAAVGIDKKLSSRSQAIASIPDEEFEATLAEHREAQQAITSTTMETLARKGAVHVSHNSGENEWYTPAEYIEAARQTMGGIDTDPASSDLANRTVRATTYYTAEQNGLERTWSGRCWMNPPYAQPLVSHFCKAVTEKFSSGEISEACVLVNNATETVWFQGVLRIASAVCFPVGRVRFLDINGKPGAPLQGQAVIYIGKNTEEFCNAFRKFGAICRM
jgi:hypothetical protein